MFWPFPWPKGMFIHRQSPALPLKVSGESGRPSMSLGKTPAASYPQNLGTDSSFCRDITNLPPDDKLSRPDGTLYLGFTTPGSSSLNLMIGASLSTSMNCSSDAALRRSTCQRIFVAVWFHSDQGPCCSNKELLHRCSCVFLPTTVLRSLTRIHT